jgi:Domain of unknown function (DUF222)
MYLRTMAASSTPHADPFGSAVQAAREALAEVAERPTWSIPDTELPELLKATDAAASAVAEMSCRLIAEAHNRNIANQHGATSTAAWLDRLTGCGRPEASRVTRTARRLTNRYELVRVALAAGKISLAKAHVIRVALDRLPTELSADTLEQAQASMLEHARVLDPKGLARVGLRLWEVIDPEAVDAHEQALLEREEAKARRSSWLTSRSENGITRFWLRTPELVGEAFLSILEGYAAPRRTDEAGPDTRPYPQRLGEAFEEWLSRQNPDDMPDHGGLPATLLITTPANGPQPKTGTTATGQLVSARTVSWLACTAWLTLMLIDDHGVPLKHGRTKRLFTLGQRLGFAVRDKGCVFPGCDRPPSWCEAHHIGSWSRGGAPTWPTAVCSAVIITG